MLEFIISMKDLMSSGLIKIAQTSKKTFASVQNNVVQTQASVKYMGASVNELRARLEAVNRVRFGTVLKSEFKSATAEAKALERQITRLENRGKSHGFMGGIARHLTPYLGAAALVFGGINLAKASVKASMDFEKSKTVYRTLTGSNSVGDQLTEELRSLKQKTIMGAAVYKTSETMLGFGVATEKVVPTLKMLGDISMGDANKLKRLSLAFSEVTAQGNLNGRRMLQFVNAGFNPLTEMARTSGKSMAELTHMLHKGEISTAMLERSFVTATSEGGRFYRMMDKIGETSVGRLKKLEGQWQNFKIQTGQALTPIISGLMLWGEKLLSLLHVNEKVSESLRGQHGEIIGLVGAITSLNEGNAIRKNMLQDLLDKYPEFFAGITAETAKNQDLLNVLEKVNGEYAKRVAKAGNKELHEEYQKYYQGASGRMQSFSVLQSLVKQGKWEEAKIVGNRLMPGNIMDYEFSDQYKERTLKRISRSLLNSTNEANKYKRLDTGVLASDAVITMQEINDFIADKKNSKIARSSDFLKEYKNLYASIGYDPATGRSSSEKLAGYDFTTIKALMAGNIKSKKTTGGGEGGTTEGGKDVASGITGGGPRVIHINGVNMKVADTITVQTADTKAFMDKLEPEMKNMFLRLLNSGASVE